MKKGKIRWEGRPIYEIISISVIPLLPDWIANIKICSQGHIYGWEANKDDPGCGRCNGVNVIFKEQRGTTIKLEDEQRIKQNRKLIEFA